jgi:uncharacterized protein
MIAVFARAPVPGRAKTRLVPRLGEWRAAQLHARLVARALRTARLARCGPVELHLATAHSMYRAGKAVKMQRGADLGERMQRAIAAGLRAHRTVIVIGSDCPALTAFDLRRAERLLRGGCDVVLAPAEDGGYALIAARRVSSRLFEGVPWGTGTVYQETLRRLKMLGWRWRALRTVWDVDRPEDLDRLRALRFSSATPRPARR